MTVSSLQTLPTLKYFQPPHSLYKKATDSDACSTVTEDLTETLDNIDFTITKCNEIAISDSSNLVKINTVEVSEISIENAEINIQNAEINIKNAEIKNIKNIHKINTFETYKMNNFPDLNNLPPVTDNVYNNAINCDELDEEIEYNDENIDNLNPVISILLRAADNTSYHTKTAKLLEHAIGANILIAEFDSKRLKLKVNPNSTIYLQDYRNIVARLEVVILCKYHELKYKMRDIEKETLLNTLSLNVVPKDGDEYNDIIHELKLFQIIRTELQI